MMDDLFFPQDPDLAHRERLKAKELKRSAWWKNQIGQGVCAYCGIRHHPSALTMDHVVPIIRGGRTTHANCVPACASCNKEKRHLSSTQWQSYLEEKLLASQSKTEQP